MSVRLCFHNHIRSCLICPFLKRCTLPESQACHRKSHSQRHRVLFLAFLVDAKTGTILEVEVNALCQITSSFLSQLLVGYSFSTQVEEMLHQVEARYWGHSRKSILVAIKQAHTKWINWSSGHRSPLS